MWRWTMRFFVVLGAFLVVAALCGATYQWLATRKDLAVIPPPGRLVDVGGYRLHLWCTGERRAGPSSSTPASAAQVLAGASSNLMLLDSRVSARTTGQAWVSAIPARRRGRHVASRVSWPNLVRSGIDVPVVLVGASIAGFDVRVFTSDHPDRAAGLVLVDASHEDDAHEVPTMARFVPLLSTLGVFRLLGVSFGLPVESLAPSVRPSARATNFRAAGYQAAADEIIHVRESASEVRRSRRKLTIPVLVITGGRGTDENWRQLQRDQASLSDRGCLIVAQQSGHVVATDQPEVVVDAIRTVVETARGHDVPLCATPAASLERNLPRH